MKYKYTDIPSEILNRKGAAKRTLIPEEIKDLLDEGIIESVNLTEWLAVDHRKLIKHVLPSFYHHTCQHALTSLGDASTMQTIAAIARTLLEDMKRYVDEEQFGILSTHTSDSVRCWAAYMVGLNKKLNFEQKMKAILPFAADKHFGVREISWMAVREDIENNLLQALPIFIDWAKSTDSNIRRFTTESIRPCGVWCKHLVAMKASPQMAIPILEQLKSDKSKYVQDSVANWLNDATKSKPEWVQKLCARWNIESPTKETKYIIKRALRSINRT